MSGAQSPYGRSMLDLVERLEALAALDRSDTEDWETVLFCELGSTPLLWPLDDVWLEILFQWAGVDLVDADDIDLAIWVVAMLLGAEREEDAVIYCGHAEAPSHFCQILDATDLTSLLATAAEAQGDGDLDPVYEVRHLRLERFAGGPGAT
jgi:hypothetical protein